MGKLDWCCPKCKSDQMFFMVSLIVSAPMEYYHNLGKTEIRKKSVKILGANWPMRDLYCKECGWEDSPVMRKENNASIRD